MGFFAIVSRDAPYSSLGLGRDQCMVQNMEGMILHADARSAHHSKANILLVSI